MMTDFTAQNIIPRSAEEACLLSKKELHALQSFGAFPDGAIIKTPQKGDKSDWISDSWVCFFFFPFWLGLKYPFPDLINRFFQTTGISYSQTQPMVWRILYSLCILNETRGTDIDLPEMAACYELRTHGKQRFTLQTLRKDRQMIPRLSHNDSDWKHKFFFVKRSSIPGGEDLPKEWILKAPKFKDLVQPNADTTLKLERFFAIPSRERGSVLVSTPSEAGSSEHTPSMSTSTRSSQRFSLDDLKSVMVKKEKSSSTPAPKSLRIPQTRNSSKKRAIDPVVDLGAFEDMDALATTDQMLLAVQHLRQLLKSQADELKEANEKWEDLQKIAAAKALDYKKLEESWEAAALARENQAYEDAKICATTSVYQAMYDMAKEAADLGVLHANWDVKHWAEVLDRPEIAVKTKVAGLDSGEGTSAGAGAGATVGDEGALNA